MDKTSYRLLTLTVSCMLFLSTTAQQVIAWPCPPCGACFTCIATGCEWDCSNPDDVCCTDSDPDSYCCEFGETCCQGDCCATNRCCDDGTCVGCPTVSSVSSVDFACVDCDVTFTANVSGSCSCVEWSGGGDPDSVSGTCTFITQWDEAGIYPVKATACEEENSASKDITVVDADLDIMDVPDNVEEDPGGYVSLNDDDDNDNGTPDKDEDGTVSGEDNLVEISLSVLPSMDSGEVKLEETTDPSRIKVWENSTKGTEVILPETWDLSLVSVPGSLYVEGINASDSPRDVELRLSFTKDSTTCDDKVKFTVLEVQVFRDSLYAYTLDDWPEDGDQLRSPKYIFGEDAPIYVQVTNIGTDPQEAETFFDFVKVTSESDTSGIIKLNLKETGVDTQIFRNSGFAGEHELLYLSTSSSYGTKEKIQVIDEEELTFWLEIQPGSDNYVTCKTVMVDRSEVGVEWQSDYETYDTGYGMLGCADDFAEGLYNEIGWIDHVWFKNFNNGDLNSEESHWDSGGDSSYADSVDFAVWCGHGPVDEVGPYMRFFVDKVGGEKQPADRLYWSEIDWGDKDLDWVALNTCRFLDGSDAQLKQMASSTRGVHLICGYKTDMTIYCPAGEYFAEKLVYRTIKQAWFDQADEYQSEEDENTARVFGASACMDDDLMGSGSLWMSRDPTSSSTYTHEDHDCF